MSSASLVQRLSNEPTPHPLETSRVGALANCVDVFSTLEKLCEDKIWILEAQKEVEPKSLFSDPGIVISLTSPWFGLSLQDIENQRSHLTRELLPWNRQNLKALKEKPH
jgi:hypothetical protein